MSCPECIAAASRPHHAFMSNCRGCQARAISRGHEFFAARKAAGRAGTPEVTAYLALIERVGLTHDEVRAAWKADAANQSASADASPGDRHGSEVEGNSSESERAPA